MKVAVLHNLAPGGAHRRLAEQVAHLDVEIVEVTTAVAEPVTVRPVVVPLRPLARKLSAALRPPLRYRDLYEVRRAWARMGQLAEASGADLIFANPDRLLTGAVDCRSRGLPVVRYCDEPRRIDHEPELAITRNGTTRLLYRDLHGREAATDRAGVTEADLILTNSGYTADRLERAYGVTAEVVSSGVPTAMTPEGPREAPHLLSVGSLLPSKGHALVIEAAAQSGLRLPVVVVAHRGNAAHERHLHATAAAHGVDLSIRLGISDAELAAHYRGAVALVYLAAREPLGLASLEAQACGCPVVLADEGGLPETLHPASQGFIVPRDAARAASALRALTANRSTVLAPPPLRASWGQSAAELLQLFARVCGEVDLRALDLAAAELGPRPPDRVI